MQVLKPWNVKITVVPEVLGALIAVSEQPQKHLKNIGILIVTSCLQKAEVILSSLRGNVIKKENNNNNNRFISSSILLHGSSPRNLYVMCMLDVFTNFFFFFFFINKYKVSAMDLSIM